MSWWLSLQKKLLTGLETIVGLCGAIRIAIVAFVLSMRSTHKLRHHALIGGLALKPPLHGHQQAVTIVEKAPIGSEVAEAAVESAMVEIHCWLTYKNVLRFVQRFRTE